MCVWKLSLHNPQTANSTSLTSKNRLAVWHKNNVKGNLETNVMCALAAVCFEISLVTNLVIYFFNSGDFKEGSQDAVSEKKTL